MRSGRSWILASLMTFSLSASLAALAGGCASPLDEPLGAQTSALRIVSDSELADVPGCETFSGTDVSGGQVLPTTHDDLYAVSVGDQLICVDSGTGVIEMQRRGVDSQVIVTPLQGTPLPARTGPATTSTDDDDTVVISGTPLPANH
jgi:hypothetical protein